MIAPIKKLRVELEDKLRHNQLLRSSISRLRLLMEEPVCARDCQSSMRYIAQLSKAARLSSDHLALRRIEGRVHKILQSADLSQIDWSEFVPQIGDRYIRKAAILKP